MEFIEVATEAVSVEAAPTSITAREGLVAAQFNGRWVDVAKITSISGMDVVVVDTPSGLASVDRNGDIFILGDEKVVKFLSGRVFMQKALAKANSFLANR